MEFITDTYQSLLFFFQWIWDFFTSGIYDLFKDGMVLLTKGAIYSYINIQILALDIAYETAQSIVSDIGVADAVRQQWSGLPADIASGLSFFGVPQALNIMFSALSTRFVLKFVPFIGR